MERERLHICIARPAGVGSKNLWKHNMICANMLHTCVFCDDIFLSFFHSAIYHMLTGKMYIQVATNTLERVAPLSHAIGNVLKRVFVIGFSIIVFGT